MLVLVAPSCVFLPPPPPPSHSINLLLELPETGILEAIFFLVLRVTVFSLEDSLVFKDAQFAIKRSEMSQSAS